MLDHTTVERNQVGVSNVSKLVLKENLWAPNDDAFEYSKLELWTVDFIATKCDELLIPKKSVIHAGGNIGMYALEFSKSFEMVYTFEPEKLNYEALVKNCGSNEKIMHYRMALSNKNECIKMINQCENHSGTWECNSSNDGTIPSIKIDQLCIPDVSVINLDVEGYELFALEGAIETIKKCRPLISVENMDHCKRFGYNIDNIMSFMTYLGYNNKIEIAHDILFAHDSYF